MPWKFVCNLWFQEVFTNNNLQADIVICLKIVVFKNFIVAARRQISMALNI